MKILRRGEKTTNSDVMVEIFCRKQGLSLFTNRGGEEVLCKANRRIGCCPPSWHSLELKDLDLKADKTLSLYTSNYFHWMLFTELEFLDLKSEKKQETNQFLFM